MMHESFFCYVLTRFENYLFAALKGHDPVLTKRARHVITEIQRTREAADALRKRDFEKVSISIRCYRMLFSFICFIFHIPISEIKT